MKRLLFLLAMAASAFPQDRPSMQLGEGRKRIALVVGNDAYLHLGRLSNAVNDAGAVGGALRESAFEVQVLENATRETLETGVEEFVRRLGRGDVALFYYSGHAVQIRGENYIAPVDLDAKTEIQARTRSIEDRSWAIAERPASASRKSRRFMALF